MGFFDFLRSALRDAAPDNLPRADMSGMAFDSLRDPRLAMFVRGSQTIAGIPVSENTAMKNTAVFRCVSLISYAIGMLPLHLINSATKEKADDHPLFNLLHREPNNWQSAFDFRSLMQMRALTKGNAYAIVIRSPATKKILRLAPIDPDRVTVKQLDDWSVEYEFKPHRSAPQTFKPDEIFHLRGLSYDGINGISLVKQAADAISLALAADLAIGRVFQNGSFIDGTLNVPREVKLNEAARKNLRESWNDRYSGAANAGKTPLLEDGIEFKLAGSTAKDAQSDETRARQVEEIARIFGVPRPLLMVDETSWGSGVDVLGQFFVRYGLNPWFEAWQQAIERSLLLQNEKGKFVAKFNAGGLLRGSMSAQGDFFAKALGSGGQQPWMTQNEVRDAFDMPSHADGGGLENPVAASTRGTADESS